MCQQEPEVKKYKCNYGDNAPVQPAGMAGEEAAGEGFAISLHSALPSSGQVFFFPAQGNASSVPRSQATGRLRVSTY